MHEDDMFIVHLTILSSPNFVVVTLNRSLYELQYMWWPVDKNTDILVANTSELNLNTAEPVLQYFKYQF